MRRKLTDEEKEAQAKIKKIKQEADCLASHLETLREEYIPEPTIQWKPGDPVQIRIAITCRK
jgi:hypothetical protein